MKFLLGGILLAVGFAALPFFTARNDLLNLWRANLPRHRPGSKLESY